MQTCFCSGKGIQVTSYVVSAMEKRPCLIMGKHHLAVLLQPHGSVQTPQMLVFMGSLLGWVFSPWRDSRGSMDDTMVLKEHTA